MKDYKEIEACEICGGETDSFWDYDTKIMFGYCVDCGNEWVIDDSHFEEMEV